MSNEVKTKNEVQNQKYIEPFVTAPKIRVISSLKQKIFKILLIILYAAVVGISISYLKDFVDDNGGLYAKKSTLLFLSSSVILGVVMVIFGGLFIQFVSRARSTVSINIFIKHFINTLSALVVIILLKFDIFGKDPKVFIKLYIYAMCGVGVLNLLTSLIVGFIENKKFPLGVKTTLLLMPGFVAIIASIFLITLQYEKIDTSSGELKDFMFVGLALVGGIVLMVLGMAFSPQTSLFDTKLQRIIKYDFLYHLLFVFASITIFLIGSFDFVTIFKYFKGMVTIGIIAALSIGIIIYMLLFSKLKKIYNVSPMSNKIILFSYMTFSMAALVWSLYGVSDFTESKIDETVYAYSIFAGVAALLTITLLVSALTSFITLEFNRFAILVSTLSQIISFLSLIAILYTQSSATLINNFMSSFVVTVLALMITLFFIVGEMFWIISLLFTKVDKKGKKKTTKKMNKKEAAMVTKEKHV